MIEQLRQKASGLFSGEADRGVSPVIGVILMVAITVILAAVIGAFVLGLGNDLGSNAAPTTATSISGDVTWDTDSYTAENIVIEHTQGDTVDSSELLIIVRDDGSNIGTIDVADLGNVDDEFSVGDTITFDSTDPTAENTILKIVADNAADNSDNLSVDLVHEPSGSTLGSGDIDSVAP